MINAVWISVACVLIAIICFLYGMEYLSDDQLFAFYLASMVWPLTLAVIIAVLPFYAAFRLGKWVKDEMQ